MGGDTGEGASKWLARGLRTTQLADMASAPSYTIRSHTWDQGQHPLFQPLFGVSFSCLNLHAFLNSGSWATRVSATLRAGAPGPPCQTGLLTCSLDVSPVLASGFSFPPNFVLVFQPDVWVAVGIVMVMVVMVMKTVVMMTLT